MTAIPILLADAVTTVINTAEAASAFWVGFTARRSYPDWDLEYTDLTETAVDVVFVSGQASGGDLVELDSVGSLNYEPSVDVCVRHRFGPSDREAKTGRLLNASVDPLVKLVEKLQEVLATNRANQIEIVSGTYAKWIDATMRTYVNQRRLREGLFEGACRVRFNVYKRGV
jgi:hypothetical protein